MRLEPFGFEAQMYGHGIVAATLANIHKGKKAQALTPNDFIPKEKAIASASSFFQNLKAMVMLKGRKDGNRSS